MNLLPKSALALSIAACLGGPVWAQQAVEAEGDALAESAAEIGADIAAEAQQILAEARAQAAAMVDAARAEADALRATAQTDSAAALARAQAEAEETTRLAAAAASGIIEAAEAEAAETRADTQRIAARLRENAARAARETQQAADIAAAENMSASSAQADALVTEGFAEAARLVAAARAEADRIARASEAEIAAEMAAARAEIEAEIEAEMRADAVRFIEEERARIAAEEEAARLAAEEAARLEAEAEARRQALAALGRCEERAGTPEAGVPVSEAAQEAALQRLRRAEADCQAAADALPEEAGVALFHLATLQQTSGRHRQAVGLYEAAADQGVVAANTRLGDYYLFGTRPIRPDPDEAATRFGLASEGGDLAGKTTLGFMYLLGIGVEGDAERAIALMQQAADGGYHFAQWRLGQIYLTGEEVRRGDQEALGIPDAERAVELLAAAARAGNSEATLVLAELFSGAEDERLPRDDAARFRWTREAAEQGLPQAINALGFLYERGIGTLPDPQRAAELYVEALEEGLSTEALRGTVDGVLPGWDGETARAFQIILSERGLYNGAIDGIVGAGTLAGARALDDG
ncbi:MAG: tetratricopeptide repeat protein [Pseudomonadota bacterium]